MRFTEEQDAVRRSRHDKTLVRALAGTGKTETVAGRVESLVREQNQPQMVLCFTRSAVEQLRGRLELNGIDGVDVRTVHSAAYWAVRNWHEDHALPLPRVNTGVEIARSVVRSAGFSGSDIETDSVLRMSSAEWNGTTVATVPASFSVDTLRGLAELYFQEKRRRNIVDFDDLTVMAAEVTSQSEQELIVDEAQDLSTVQQRFIEQASARSPLTLVGDQHQSVFGFAGVDGGMFDRLGSDWASYGLTWSFRSTQEVLDVANQMIPETLRSEKTGGVADFTTMDYEDVASYLLQHVEPGDAVIGRTRNDCERVSKALEDQGGVIRRHCDEARSDSCIDVSTVHSAKGSEWERVFIIDTTSSGFNGFMATAEEQRVFYVAVTRARKHLSIIGLEAEPAWGITV